MSTKLRTFLLILFFTSACGVNTGLNPTLGNAIENYKFTEQYGDGEDVCIAAGVVKLEYLDIRDLENYKKWKRVQNEKCSLIGY